MSVVLDANVIVALLVDDEHQSIAQDCVEKWIAAGQRLHAPGVLPYEVANVLARLVFEGTLTLHDVAEIWHDLAALGVELHPFDYIRDGPEVAAITADLSRRHATDSVYVGLAQRLGTQLCTLDGALARNAASLGLPVTLLTAEHKDG